MKFKRFILLIMSALFLVGCGAADPDLAINYLSALNQRDLETASALVCEARQDDVTMGLTTVDDPNVEPFMFTNVSCSARGTDLMCRFTVEQETESQETIIVQQTRQVVFEVENGRICGFEEEVVNE